MSHFCDEPLPTLAAENISDLLLEGFNNAGTSGSVRLQIQRFALLHPKHPKHAFVLALLISSNSFRKGETQQPAQFLLSGRPAEAAVRCHELCLGPLAVRFEKPIMLAV